jgi:hypothetical protein
VIDQRDRLVEELAADAEHRDEVAVLKEQIGSSRRPTGRLQERYARAGPDARAGPGRAQRRSGQCPADLAGRPRPAAGAGRAGRALRLRLTLGAGGTGRTLRAGGALRALRADPALLPEQTSCGEASG